MVDWAIFFKGLSLIASWEIFVLMTIGMFLGLIFGVIPGLTGSLCIAVLLPLTFLMDALTALAFLTAVYTGGLTGGGITAILINTPGTPGAVATTFDGYPMTKQGLQNEALGLQITSSVIGGLAGYIFLLFLIQPLVKIALEFGPSEMVFLTLLMLVIIGTLGGRSLSRTLMVGMFGLLLGTIGTSEGTGLIRGTMGFAELEDGLPHIALIIGMFAIPEMLDLITRSFIIEVEVESGHNFKKLLAGMRATFRYPRTLIRSCLTGIGIGVLPGIGSTLGCILSYAQAKRRARPDQHFGEGEPEGIVAAETANNASEGGAMGILLALGIPGSGSTAILIGAFMLHGMIPGPRLLKENGPLIYGLISANIVQLLLLVFIAVFIAFYMARVIFVPTRIVAPTLLSVMAIGAFSLRNMHFDVYLLFFFGVVAWFLRKNEFPIISFMIGIILGNRLDMEMFRYAILFGTDFSILLKRPISLILIAIILLTFGLNLHRSMKERKAMKIGKQQV